VIHGVKNLLSVSRIRNFEPTLLSGLGCSHMIHYILTNKLEICQLQLIIGVPLYFLLIFNSWSWIFSFSNVFIYV